MFLCVCEESTRSQQAFPTKPHLKDLMFLLSLLWYRQFTFPVAFPVEGKASGADSESSHTSQAQSVGAQESNHADYSSFFNSFSRLNLLIY